VVSRTTDEQIAALSVFSEPAPTEDSFWGTTAGGVKRLDMILVAAQAIAEICLLTVQAFDAYRIQTVATVEIPRLEAFTSPKTRATQFREPIQEIRRALDSLNRGARGVASGPHPGLLPGGEGEIAPRVSEGMARRSLERISTARTVGFQREVAGHTRLPLTAPSPAGRGLG